MPTQRKLTIGMPVFDDFDGVYFTVQAIRMFHPEVLGEVEFVIVDNHPESVSGKAVKSFTGWMKEPVRYVPYTGTTGAANAKQEVIERAETPYVMCIDCHILMVPGAIKRLIETFDRGEDGSNLLQGPLLYDNLTSTSTHLSQVWRGSMWGIWASAWRCVCGSPFQTALIQNGKDSQVGFQSIMSHHKPLHACAECGTPFPDSLPWTCHEPKLREKGFVSASDVPRPFEIPAQGMGAFACRRDAWLGFNPRFRGFGGEECYIHEKFRRAGHKAMCLPFLKWVHRFGRPGGVPYKLVMEDRIFNYLVGHDELGLDPAPVLEHFKDKVPAANLERLIREALNLTADTTLEPGAQCLPNSAIRTDRSPKAL